MFDINGNDADGHRDPYVHICRQEGYRYRNKPKHLNGQACEAM